MFTTLSISEKNVNTYINNVRSVIIRDIGMGSSLCEYVIWSIDFDYIYIEQRVKLSNGFTISSVRDLMPCKFRIYNFNTQKIKHLAL